MKILSHLTPYILLYVLLWPAAYKAGSRLHTEYLPGFSTLEILQGPSSWYQFGTREGRFFIQFPTQPKAELRKDAKSAFDYTVTNVYDSTTFEVIITGLSPDQAKEERLKDITEDLIKRTGAVTETQKPFSISDYAGMEMKLVLPENEFRYYRLVIVKNVKYELAVTRNFQYPDYKMTRKYFESFRLLD